jgi:hypothetical protein
MRGRDVVELPLHVPPGSVELGLEEEALAFPEEPAEGRRAAALGDLPLDGLEAVERLRLRRRRAHEHLRLRAGGDPGAERGQVSRNLGRSLGMHGAYHARVGPAWKALRAQPIALPL